MTFLTAGAERETDRHYGERRIDNDRSNDGGHCRTPENRAAILERATVEKRDSTFCMFDPTGLCNLHGKYSDSSRAS
jgi:hypothetical protein